MNAVAMGLTIDFSTPRREPRCAILDRLEYGPVLARWSIAEGRGSMSVFACLVPRGGGGRR